MKDKQATALGWAISWCNDALILARKRAWVCANTNPNDPTWFSIWLRDIRAIQDAIDEIHGDYSI